MNSFLRDVGILKPATHPTAGFVKATDNTSLAYNAYTSAKPLGAMVFLHGGGAHGLAGYTSMAEQLFQKYRIATYLFDIRGHGKSGGKRGHTPSREQAWEDISSAISFLKKKFNNAPIYLGGHSSGAGLVLNYSCWQKRLPISAYVMVAPEFGSRASAKVNYRNKEQKFAKVNSKLIILNKLSGGYLFSDSLAVEFNYSKELIEKNGLLPGYTVNMALAVTPEDPATSLKNLREPTYILSSENDELK